MGQPLFSIIIPHHNTPRQLSRLLDSIPWVLTPEVIVVDDASEVSNQKEVEQLAGRFEFQLYSICRHTAGAARNEGLKHATGQWLLFADADDFYLPEVEVLLREHAQDKAEVVYFGVQSAYSHSGQPAYRDRQIDQLIRRCECENSLNPLRALHTNPWGKMIRRELVERCNIRFEEIPAANDAMFSVQVGVSAKKVTLDRRNLYCITVNDDSLTSNVDFARFESHGQARLRVNAYLREQRMERYQLSVLSYMLPAWQYGVRYGWRVNRDCWSRGNRPWVGIKDLLNVRKCLHSLRSWPKERVKK